MIAEFEWPAYTPQHVVAKNGTRRCVRLKDGRFHLVQPGPLVPLFSGGNHIVASETFAAVLRETCAHSVDLRETEVVQLATGETFGRYYEVRPHEEIFPENINQVQVSGCHVWHFRHGELFVSPSLAELVRQRGITELIFSPSFTGFAGSAWTE